MQNIPACRMYMEKSKFSVSYLFDLCNEKVFIKYRTETNTYNETVTYEVLSTLCQARTQMPEPTGLATYSSPVTSDHLSSPAFYWASPYFLQQLSCPARTGTIVLRCCHLWLAAFRASCFAVFLKTGASRKSSDGLLVYYCSVVQTRHHYFWYDRILKQRKM